MTCSEKIKKLANAVRRWRGLAHGGRFIIAPQSHAATNVVKWLHALGHPPEIIKSEIQLLAGFKKIEEFNQWIRDLDKPSPLSTAAVMGGVA